MANIPEASAWEAGIYQIETTDPVIGGAPNLATKHGVPNIPNQQLANRTLFLKAAVEALQTALPGYATPADITAAINDLIDGAPAALDTLKELSDALADSDDAIAALVASVATKLDTAAYTAADILAKLLTVDGTGSNLDADKLDGEQGSYYRDVGNMDAGVLPIARGGTGGGTTAAARTALGLVIGTHVQAFSAALAALAGGSVATGITAAAVDDGTRSAGTYTPTPSGGNARRIVNGGAFTLAAPTEPGDFTMLVHVTNDATAGAVTMTGFSGGVSGDGFSVVDGQKFAVAITKIYGDVFATIKKMEA